jgi:hypothetical protein
MKVQATAKGFIYGERRNPGDKFTLVDVKMANGEIYKAKDQLSKNWMEVVAKAKSQEQA